MTSRPTKFGRKPGATHEQVDRRERFTRARREDLRAAAGDDEPVILYGWHTVTAALRNPARRFRKFLATDNAARRLAEEGIEGAIAPEVVRPSAIDERLLPDAVHQGLYLEADPLPAPAIEDVPARGTVLVLDHITDPHTAPGRPASDCSSSRNGGGASNSGWIRHPPPPCSSGGSRG